MEYGSHYYKSSMHRKRMTTEHPATQVGNLIKDPFMSVRLYSLGQKEPQMVPFTPAYQPIRPAGMVLPVPLSEYKDTSKVKTPKNKKTKDSITALPFSRGFKSAV